MVVVEHARLAPSHLPGIEHRTVAGGAQGLSHLSLWRQTIEPGGATPPHRHDCEEAVVVLAGHGRLRIHGVEHRFGPDTTLVIPAGVDHQIFSDGPGLLHCVAAFAATPVGVVLPDGTPLELPWAT